MSASPAVGPDSAAALRPVEPSTADPVLCPLCDYDLRGLTEPRCPECGYRFEWGVIRDPARRVHPYLFEHHPERNVAAFWRTLAGGFHPRRFWTTLFPTQPSRPRRLLLYWALAALPLVVAVFAEQGASLRSHAGEIVALRAKVTRNVQTDVSSAAWVTRQYGTLAHYLDESWPTAPSWGFFRNFYRHGPGPYAWLALLVLGRPWLTFLALLVFRISMRRSRIKPVHVLRCVLYSSDQMLWVGLLVAGIVAYEAYVLLSLGVPLPGAEFRFLGPLAAGILATVWSVYCLASAYRHYLRFDHPLLTVLAAQVVVVLLVAVVAINLLVYFT
jgi:hypothetical protein